MIWLKILGATVAGYHISAQVHFISKGEWEKQKKPVDELVAAVVTRHHNNEIVPGENGI